MMVDEGVLNGVSGVFGMHVWPLYPSGVAAIRVGHMLGLPSVAAGKSRLSCAMHADTHLGSHSTMPGSNSPCHAVIMHLAVLYAAPAPHHASAVGSLSGSAQEHGENLLQGSAVLPVLPRAAAGTSMPGRQTAWQQTQTALLPSDAPACNRHRCAAALQASTMLQPQARLSVQTACMKQYSAGPLWPAMHGMPPAGPWLICPAGRHCGGSQVEMVSSAAHIAAGNSSPVCLQAGTMMAASDKFEAIIYGRGGHGAMPHLTADPVVAGAQAVLALQPLISRELNPTDSGVVTVARFSTGGQRVSLQVVDGHPVEKAGGRHNPSCW